MILDYFEGKMDGDSWEDLCQSCYRIRYQEQHYTEIPAVQGGDAGIEGFTRTGVVNQCYYPEREYSEDELYKHQRNKMTKDINKLLDKGYKGRLKDLGVPVIHEWHFVIPYYKDSRIIQHAETKRQEVLQCKKDNPDQYDYIADDFIIVIKQAEDFKFEITRSIRKSYTDVKLNAAVLDVKEIDWKKCDSEKTANIRNKVKAVMSGIDEEDDAYKQVVDTFIESYIKGIEVFRNLRLSCSEMFEDVFSLVKAYKSQVSVKTCMNTDKSMNLQIFNEILDDFGKQLKETCPYFTDASVIELKMDIVSMWLADCSMKFRK